MKFFVAIAALFILARPALPVVEYFINYDYISKVLCVNKEKPALQCNGKCHLMKQLAKAAEDEKPLSDKKNHRTETEVLFFQSITQFNLTNRFFVITAITYPTYTNLYTHLTNRVVFHPPAFIS
ncbi:hypothetical protein [Flavobacterium rhizosphaerae]|uniref:Uncharacterized protein n=1 Tax=Flavobacterium rhizosphaerae TaxID=3163298 RepID=A0ABW8YXW3_9FLAO